MLLYLSLWLKSQKKTLFLHKLGWKEHVGNNNNNLRGVVLHTCISSNRGLGVMQYQISHWAKPQ